jgi:nucleotide-binding universal stress UspA family protein
MLMLSRILAPIAFSARCKGAVQYAEALACHFHSELTLLHVVAPVQSYALPDAMAVAPEMMDEIVAFARTELDRYARDEIKGISAKQELLEGDPAAEIVRYAAEGKFDLIIMSTHGYGPFRRFLLGSVTAKVLHDAPCPVWTGPHMENAPAYQSIDFWRVLCAIDLGPHSGAVLQWAADFAQDYGATLVVMHAIPGSTVTVGGVYFDPEWREQVRSDARNRISSLLNEMGITAEIEIAPGDPPETVRTIADESGANLLLIGRGGARGVIGRLRANAYGILRESPCPVVAI